MNKEIFAYIIILAFAIVAVLLLSGYIKLGGSNPTTTATTSAQTNTSGTTTIPANQTSLSTTTVVFSSCMSKNETVGISNGDFSTGTYYGWNASEPGFGTTPLNIIYANAKGIYYAAPWSGYNGNYMATTYHGGLALQQGNLTSKPFKVTQLYLNFKVISPQSNLLYVEILKNNRSVITAHYNTYTAPGNTNGPTTFENASIPLGGLLCQNVSIRVVADVVGTPFITSSYIAVGDFYMGRLPVSTPGIVVNQTIS